MKIIDVLNLMAEGKIKANTKLIIYNDSGERSFLYSEKDHRFFNKYSNRLEDFRIDKHFLNLEVELIPPKEKKYLVKLHIKGLLNIRNYLNYYNDGIKQWIELGNDLVQGFYQTRFTKQKMQDIKLVREFLEDMEGKYELIEVEDNEVD